MHIFIVHLLVVVLSFCCHSMAYSGNNYRDLDICNHWNGRRHFLELGERGDLHARNVTTSAFRSTLFSPPVSGGVGTSLSSIAFNRNQSSPTSTDVWYQCNLELVTCAECVIRITFTHSNFSKSCERTVKNPAICPCEHIQLSEPPYDSSISGQEFCGNGKVFRSRTRTLLLKFFYRATNSHVFSLQYFSERNVKVISGSPKQSIVSNYSKYLPEIISTPYFPMPYPRDYGIEHILTCEADDCQVRLDFTDFQLGLSSTLEIFDSNGQMLDSYSGEHFRPPITVSNGKSLLIQFRGNGASGVGFRAEVTFISLKQLREERLVPFTDCGGIVSGPGGAITMMNMIENTTDVRFYDCIWIIKPGNNYMMMKTHISLRVEEFLGMASRSDLTIRQGTTSDAAELEKIVWPNNGLSKQNHIVPILSGYYIRLRGSFGISSKLAIVYSVFNYINCYIGSEFLCGNNHCISIRLHCDSFDHCGDGTDEPESCEKDWAHLHNDRRWYSHKPNYYFPKIEQYPDLKTATGIFIISTLAIFAVLSGWMVILYRMGVRARQQRELQNHLQTISELLDRQEESLPPDDPPSYEAPPDYDEVIKVGMEQELHEPRQHERERDRTRHRPHGHRHRERSCSRAPSNVTLQSTIVPIHGRTNGTDGDNELRENSGEGPSSSGVVNIAVDSNAMDRQTEAEKIANRVLMAAALCGSGEASRSKGGEQWCSGPSSNYKSVGVSTSPVSISSGGELSAASTEARYFAANSSLVPPPTTIRPVVNAIQQSSVASTVVNGGGISNSSSSSVGIACNMENVRSRSAMDCNEQTYLKKSCQIEPNQGTQTYKIQRLRHTFSSPEAFTAGSNELQLPDVRTYGTNLPHERSLNLSVVGGTFGGTEPSRDTSKNSSWGSGGGGGSDYEQQFRNGQEIQHCVLLHFPFYGASIASVGGETSTKNGGGGAPTNADSNATLLGLSMEEVNMDDDHTKRLIVSIEPDSDYERDTKKISCFGSVNRPRTFRVGGFRQRHVRSKSLTNTMGGQRNNTFTSSSSVVTHENRTSSSIKRSSSADLLERITASIPRSVGITGCSGTAGGTAQVQREPNCSGYREGRRPVYI